MSLESKLPRAFENFARQHYLNEANKRTLEKYFEYSSRLTGKIVRWYNFQDRMHLEVLAAAENRNDMDTYWDSRNPALEILPFFERNYDVIASFSSELGTAIILPAIRHCADRKEEAQGMLDDILSFWKDDNKLPPESREHLIFFMGRISARELDGFSSLPGGFNRKEVKCLIEAYHDWRELQLNDKTAIGPRLLEKIAQDCQLPVLGEGGIIALMSKEDVEKMNYHFQPLRDAVQAYKRYFNLQSEVKLPPEMVVIMTKHLVNAMQEGQYHSIRITFGEKADTTFWRMGWLQKQFDSMHQKMRQLGDDNGLTQELVNRLSKDLQLPVLDMPGNLHLRYLDNKIFDDRLSAFLQDSQEGPGPPLLHIELINGALEHYQNHGINSSLRYQREGMINGISSFFARHGSGTMGGLFAVMAAQQAGTIDEAIECAELNLEMQSEGYRVLRKISSGSFKDVYLAQDDLGAECVLKKIINERVATRLKGKVTPEEMTKKEFRSSPFQMRHAHINPTVPHFSARAVYILEPKYEQTMEQLVRELQQGKAFGKDPQGKGTILLYPYSETVIRLMYQLASALEYCHEQDIIHGDFKLDNVGIRHDGKRGKYALLSDFGMATKDEHQTGEKEFTYNLGRVYTKHPGLFREGSHADKFTDAFSFGAELFFLCTGRYPFSNEKEVPDYTQREERKKYLERVHALVKKGENQWVGALHTNIEKYFPVGITIYRSYWDKNIFHPDEEVDYALAKQLYQLNKYCLRSEFFVVEPPAKQKQPYIIGGSWWQAQKPLTSEELNKLMPIYNNPFAEIKKELGDILEKISQFEK